MVSSKKSLMQDIVERGVLAVAAEMTDEAAIEVTETYGAHNYHPLPVNITHAIGARAYDGAGNEYIDCVGAYSAMAHGHLAPAIVKVIRDQLDRLAVTSRAFYTSEVALFVQGLAEYAELEMVCPMNTGAEAVETCLKLARKWAYTVKGVPKDQAEIIVCENNFHGRTITIVGFSTEKQYREGFGPFPAGFKTIPFGDADALEAAITPNTAAFLAEPIQAEAGILVPDEGYLARVREICDRNRVLLIWDEVQTGFCRTGRKFAWMHEQARPDLMAVGKPLGGGILPVSGAVGTREAVGVFRPGDHGSTFGGNPLGAVVALTAMAEMEAHDYAGRSERLGNRLKEHFANLPGDAVADIRGKGLLVGLEFDPSVDSERLTHAFLQNGLLTKETRHHTFRFAPPLIADEADIDAIAEKVATALKQTI